MNAHERVKKGVNFMDEICPRWKEKIRVSRFSIGDCERCILGQVYGEYWGALARITGLSAGLATAREAEEWARNHGFEGSLDASFEDLQAAWLEVLQSRKGGADHG